MGPPPKVSPMPSFNTLLSGYVPDAARLNTDRFGLPRGTVLRCCGWTRSKKAEEKTTYRCPVEGLDSVPEGVAFLSLADGHGDSIRLLMVAVGDPSIVPLFGPTTMQIIADEWAEAVRRDDDTDGLYDDAGPMPEGICDDGSIAVEGR